MLGDSSIRKVPQVAKLAAQTIRSGELHVQEVGRRAKDFQVAESIDVLEHERPAMPKHLMVFQPALTMIARRWLVQISGGEQLERACVAQGVGDGPSKVPATDDEVSLATSAQDPSRTAAPADGPAEIARLRTRCQPQHIDILLKNK